MGTKIAPAIIIVVACLAVYLNSLSGAFVLDDHLLIAGNAYIRGARGIPHFFTENIASGSGANWGFWRPLQMATYVLDHSFWKLTPAGYHLTNIFLHILVGLCIWYLIRLLFSDGLIALCTALLFVVHPLQTEAVTYISGRADSLVFLCMLMGLIAYINYTRQGLRRFYLYAFACFAAALLSRENSLIFPFLLLLYHATAKVRLKIWTVLPYAALAALYILLRLTVLNFQKVDAVSFLQRLPGFFAAVTQYARLIVFPVGLHMEYGKKLFLWSDWRVLTGVFGMAIVVVAALRARATSIFLFFGLSWFILTLIPQANLLYPLNAYMAEHWLYIPLMGIFLAAAVFVRRLYRRKGMIPAAALMTLLVVFYGVLTVRQNSLWRDPVTLYESTLRYAPDSSRVLICLGNEFSRQKDYQGAARLYKKALYLEPSADAYFNLGNAYRLAGDSLGAVAAYRAALALDPRHGRAQHNLDGMRMLENE